MKLLIVTQTVDLDDPVLGFFHQWIAKLAPAFEQVSVICLREGKHSLPSNVTVYSLGKEGGQSHFKYLARWCWYLVKLHAEYNSVFVHMNEEYVVLAGWWWWLTQKRVALWRNFHSGTWKTPIAAWFSNTVLYTSRSSYTARFKNSIQMPVGVDLDLFGHTNTTQVPGTLLSLGRITPVKRLEVLLAAILILKERGTTLNTDVYGDALPEDQEYYAGLKTFVAEKVLPVSFHPGVPAREADALFASHEFFVNASPSGMYDKTIVEAAASGALPVASSLDYAEDFTTELAFTDSDAESLANRLEALTKLPDAEKDTFRVQVQKKAKLHSLETLVSRLTEVLQ